MSVITFPKILAERLTDEGAKALADIFNTVESSAQRITLEIAEERFEKRLAQLDAKIDTVAAKLDAKIDTVEARLETKIAESKTELKTEIANVKTEVAQSEARIIKWMFIFWAGQIGGMTAILFLFFKH